MALKDLIKTVRERANLTQAELAKKLKTTSMTVSRWERGINEPDSETLDQMGIEYRIKGSGNDETSTITPSTGVPVISGIIQASAGTGNYYDGIEWNETGIFPVPDEMLFGYAWQGAQFRIIRADGDSMEPYIHHGDKLLFAANIEVTSGNVAIVDYCGRLLVKGVIFNRDGTITLRSFNKDYKDFTADADEIKICGKVLKRLAADSIPNII